MARVLCHATESSESGEESDVEQQKRRLLPRFFRPHKEVELSSFAVWRSCFGRAASGFAEDTEISIRAAIMCVVFVAPFMTPPGTIPLSHKVHQMLLKLGLAQNGAMYFLFTIWKSLGSTLDLLRQNIIGLTIWAVHHMLWTFFRHHTGIEAVHHGISMTSLLIWIEGVIYIFVSLWLNFNPNVALWAVCMFMWTWMDSLQPNHSSSSQSMLIQNYVGMLLGGLLAIIACLLPYPMLAIWKAKDATKEILATLDNSWADFVGSFSQQDAEARMNFVARDMRHARQRLSTLEGQLGESRWESYFYPRWRQSFKVMTHCMPYMQEACDGLIATVSSCLEYQTVDVGKAGTVLLEELLAQLSKPMEEVVTTLARVQSLIVQAIDSGEVSESDAEAMDHAMDEAKAASASLTAILRQRSEQMGAASVSIMTISIACFELAAFSGDTVSIAADLAADGTGERPLPAMPGIFAGAKGTFDPKVLYDPQHVRWVLRFLLLLVTAQVVGYDGLGLIPPYSVYISNVISVMVNQRGPGSELMKDFARIQGMIMGTVGGQFINAFFGGCSPEQQAAIFPILLVWMSAAFFMVFHSQEYTHMYFGYMLAEFGTFEMVVDCSKHTYAPAEMFSRVSCLILSLLMLMVIGALIRQPRASKVAGVAVADAFRSIHESFNSLYDPDVEEVDIDFAAISASLSKAATCGAEAVKEPQNCRLPWKGAMFDKVVAAAQGFNSMLTTLSRAAQLGATEEGLKSPFFLEMTKLRSFQDLWSIQHEVVKILSDMVADVFREENDSPSASTLGKMVQFEHKDRSWEEARHALTTELEQLVAKNAKQDFLEKSDAVRTVMASYRVMRGKVDELTSAFLYD